jgi:glycosyltransferase involved in cell wall biosynthesis
MKRILIVADYEQSGGGIAVQVTSILKMLDKSPNYKVRLFNTRGYYLLKPFTFAKVLYTSKKYDTIHVHGCSYWGFLTIIFAALSAKLWHKQLIITYHGGSAPKFFNSHPIFLRVMRMAKIVTVPSPYLNEYFQSKRIQTRIVENFVELHHFTYKNKERLEPRFITTRVVKPVYNIRMAIDAFYLVKDRYPQAELLIVGDGPQRRELEGYVQQRKIQGIQFSGKVENSKIPEILRDYDILLNPSLVDNTPLSIIEAFAAGLLVISTNVGGIPYMMQHGETGYILNRNTDKDLAQVMIGALENNGNSLRIIQNARKDAQKYDEEHVRSKWFQVYA